MAEHYSYRVSWSEDDGEWVGTCAEFPSLSHLSAHSGDALRGIQELVKDVVSDMRESGEAVPEPLSSKTYSGKFVVRVPSELHRRLVVEAAEAHVSLNRLISFRLAMSAPSLIRSELEDQATQEAPGSRKHGRVVALGQ